MAMTIDSMRSMSIQVPFDSDFPRPSRSVNQARNSRHAEVFTAGMASRGSGMRHHRVEVTAALGDRVRYSIERADLRAESRATETAPRLDARRRAEGIAQARVVEQAKRGGREAVERPANEARDAIRH